MIRYALVCDEGHEFDSWFRDADAFEGQAARGLVSCARCGSTRVAKAIMAPSVARRDRDGAPAPAARPAAPEPVALIDDRQRELRGAIRALRAEIEAKTEDLGARFPEEARRIHEGEAPPRSIRGAASLEDARALIEDGIEILPIPVLPDERN